MADVRDERIDYDPRSGTYRLEFDWTTDEPLTHAVATMLGAVTDRDPLNIPPMYESIDLEAATTVLCTRVGTPREDVSVCFTHADCDVTIHGSGTIVVEPLVTRGADDRLVTTASSD